MKNKLLKIVLYILLFVAVFLITFYVSDKITKKADSNNQIEIMAENASNETHNQNDTELNDDELKIVECQIDGKTYKVIAVLYIPKLDIEYPVLSSTSKELLKVSLNKYWGPNPNKPGNLCILGHNYNDEKFFGKLHNIKIGDYIQLTDMYGKTLQYCVYDTYIVDPDNTDCTSQLTNGETQITLITCTKDFRRRFIVKARAEEV